MTLDIYQQHAHVSKQTILKQSYTHCIFFTFNFEKNIKSLRIKHKNSTR